MSKISIRFLLVIFGVSVLVLAAAGSEVSAKDGLLAEYNRITKPPDYDPRHNSAELFEKAANAYVPRPQSIPWVCDYWGLSRKQRSDLQDWLESNEECIRFFTLAADRKYYWKQYQAKNNEMKDLGFLELDRFTDMSKLLFWQAEKIADQGNVTGAFELLTSAYKVGCQFQVPRTLIEQMLGVGICAGSCASLWLFTDDGNGNGKLISEQLVKEFDNPMLPEMSLQKARGIAETHPDKRQTIAILEQFQKEINVIHKQTPWALHQRNTDYAKEASRLTAKAYILEVSSMARLIYSIKHVYRARFEALITTLAVLRYKADKGAMPDKLEALVEGGYLRLLPADPCSDGPLVYREIDDDFTLYSVGMDFKDDGGKHVGWSSEKDGDFVFWPVQKLAID